MNINLANIDFAPGQGGGGGSITPEEQAALDTLVDSSKGTLYTETYKRYNQLGVNYPSGNIYPSSANAVFWDDLYIINGNDLYKLNRESYQFDMINHFNNMYAGPSFFGDKSGRLYWDGKELDLENGTIGQNQISLPEYYKFETTQNIFYGEYGVWIIGISAYKFNESSQEFEQKTLNNTFQYSGQSQYTSMFKYDGHILGVYEGLTFEVTEYEDHIDVSDVTGVYFNMPSFGGIFYNFKSTKDGDLYYIEGYIIYKYDKSSGNWVSIEDKTMQYPIYGQAALVSDNIIFSFYDGNISYMSLGSEFSNTFWTKMSNVAVDLTSNQVIRGQKRFVDNALFETIQAKGISGSNGVTINAQNNSLINIGGNIVFINDQGKETIVKNGSKHIATVDQTFVNSTYIPYGTDGDNIGYVEGDPNVLYNFNTYTNRMFKKVGSDWKEFDGTSTLIPVSFGFEFNGDLVCNSPTMTIVIVYSNNVNNTYMWNDANTRWDLICSSESVGGNVWFDGDNFRSGNTYKLVETGGVWSWVEDPLVNNIWDSYLKFVYKNGEVYAYNESDWYLYKYDKVNCTLDKIGFLNAGRIWAYFNELFMAVNSNETYIVDLSKVDPQNPDENLLGKLLFNNNTYGFIGARDRLWYYNTNNQMCSSYQYIYETPEVPASDGTYTLKAVRVGDQITYNWVLDV